MITIMGYVKKNGRIVAKRFMRRETRGQASFDASVWAESEYNRRKAEGKEPSSWGTREIVR